MINEVFEAVATFAGMSANRFGEVRETLLSNWTKQQGSNKEATRKKQESSNEATKQAKKSLHSEEK